jgi:uncharacterized protein
MSENINDRKYRRETLKQIIRDIHLNKDPLELKNRFKELISGVGPTEIAELEQELIAEGMPEAEIKRLCDVHVSVFKDTLDQQPRPEETPGHPVQTFKKENRAVEKEINNLREIFEKIKAEPEVDSVSISRWKELHQPLLQLDRHYSRKENILFPFLEKHGISGPPSVMWAIQDDIRAQLKQVSVFLDQGTKSKQEIDTFISEHAIPVLTTINDMIYKEENIMFPMCMETLSEQEWGEISGQSDEIGYCLIEPDSGWRPGEGQPGQPKEEMLPKGNLKFKTGILTQEEISLIFDNLPVDITFVDKDDRVKYFSSAKERIFPRTPAIIGREVKNCHPPDSVHVVNKIVEEFKKGTKDVADFWITMGEMFVFIRYFAIRNEDGEYLGTLEVTQNVSDIKKLEGQKRILDWS